MVIPGPVNVQQVDPALRHELALRPFQRISAEVLQVSATQAVLSIEGYPVVAQLTSADQAALLKAGRQANFVVAQLDDQTLVLRFVRPAQTAAAGTVLGGEGGRVDLATHLLAELGKPVTAENLLLARALLDQRLPGTAEAFQELSAALNGLGQWGENEAELAAALKAAGLPLTPASLGLALKGGADAGDAMARLSGLLQQAAGADELPETLRAALTQSLLLLDEAAVDWNESGGQIAGRLKAAVDLLGRSLENILKNQIEDKSPFWPEKSLMRLAHLQEQFREAGQPEMAEVVTRFLDDLRQNHLANARLDAQPGSGQSAAQWAQAGFMLRLTNQGPEAELYPARLRVERRPGSQGKIDAENTRLKIQVDLEGGERMEVALALANKQIRAEVTTTSPGLRERAVEEMPSFKEALEQLGYLLQDLQVTQGRALAFETVEIRSGGQDGPADTHLSVDLEV